MHIVGVKFAATPQGHLLRGLAVAFGLAIGIGTTIGGGILCTPGDIAALLRLDPIWDPLHRDPAFLALLKKYGGTGAADQAASGSSTATKGKR